MEIEIVGNGQLGGERDLVEGMQLGTIEMASTANMVLSNFDPRFAVLDLPYLITDYETAYRVLDSDVIQDLQDSFAEQSGVRVLAYGQGGFRQVIGNVAVNSLADMHGMKVRVPESDIYIDTFSALGANPTPLAYSETFTALQQGTVDAFEITPAVVLSAGFWEVCSDMNMTNHLFSPNPLMISENLFQSLTEEQQDILTEYPTLMRPILLRNSRYNQHATVGSLLVEVGAAGNSPEEAALAGRLFAERMVEVLEARSK